MGTRGVRPAPTMCAVNLGGVRAGLVVLLAPLVVWLAVSPAVVGQASAAEPDPPPPVAFHGTVTGAGGEPMAGVAVTAHAWLGEVEGWKFNSAAVGTTDDEGVFTLRGIEPGRYTLQYARPYVSSHLTTFWGGGLSWNAAVAIDLGEGDPPFDASIAMVKGASISGRVTAADGTPLASAEIDLHRGDQQFPLSISADANGEYQAIALQPGEYEVNLKGPRGGRWIDVWWPDAEHRGHAGSVRVDAGDALTGIDATLFAASSITGRLLGRAGQALDGYSISAHRQDPDDAAQWTWTESARSAADGEFALRGLRAGRYRLQVHPADPYGDHRTHWWPATLDETAASVIDLAPETDHSVGTITALGRITVRTQGYLSAEQPVVGTAVHTMVLVQADGTVDRHVQWFRDGAAIEGAHDGSYLPTAADIGARLSATVHLSGASLVPETVVLPETQPVLIGPPQHDATPQPEIRRYGPLSTDTDLEAYPGTTWFHGVTFSYQWQRDGLAIAGATAARYRLAAADVSRSIRAVITGTRPGYTPVTVVTPSVRPTAAAFANVAPTIGGTRAVGRTLTASTTWPAGSTLRYQWYRNGKAVSGATRGSYTLKASDLGDRFTVRITASRAGYTTRARTSASTTTIKRGTLTTTGVTIAGTATTGKTLTASRTGWGPGKLSYSYRWYRDGKAIAGATGRSYRVKAADRRHTLTVRVSATKPGYSKAVRRSPGVRVAR